MSSELTFNPLSHKHPLQLSNYDESKTTKTREGFCEACKLKASGWICSCKDCNFILHFQCSIAPQLIRHPFHRNHDLSLVPDHGIFKCRACGDQGFKFAYSCTRCPQIALHFDCARSPQVLTHQSHSHTLDLAFLFPNKTMSSDSDCNVCQGSISSNCWRYECDGCGQFNAHLDCAKSDKVVAQISSGATSNKGKEKGFNSRYADGNHLNQKQSGNQNDYGSERSRYTQETSRRGGGNGNQNAKAKTYASSQNSGAGGGSGYRQQNPVAHGRFGGYGSNDIQDGLNYNSDGSDDIQDSLDYISDGSVDSQEDFGAGSNYSMSAGNQKRFGNRTHVGPTHVPKTTSNRPANGGGRNHNTQDSYSRNNDRWRGDGNQNANKKATGASRGGGYMNQNSVHQTQDDLDSDSSTHYGSDDEDYLY